MEGAGYGKNILNRRLCPVRHACCPAVQPRVRGNARETDKLHGRVPSHRVSALHGGPHPGLWSRGSRIDSGVRFPHGHAHAGSARSVHGSGSARAAQTHFKGQSTTAVLTYAELWPYSVRSGGMCASSLWTHWVSPADVQAPSSMVLIGRGGIRSKGVR